MSKSAKSVFIFGIYLAINGLMLLFIPNTLLSTLDIEPAREVWIRLSGILLLAISVYYFLGALYEYTVILKATAYIRFSIIFFFTAFVLFDLVSPRLIIISAIDFAGGLWTYILLRKEGHFSQKQKG